MSQTHYQLIGDQSALRRLYQTLIKPYQTHPKAGQYAFKLLLVARRKYFPDLSICQRLIDRRLFYVYKSEEEFIRTIQKYEVPMGTYVDDRRADGEEKPLPSEALALYMTTNPCDTLKAITKTEQEMSVRKEEMMNYAQKLALYAEQLLKLKPTSDSSVSKPSPPSPVRYESLFKTQVQIAAEPEFWKLDIDTHDSSLLQELEDFLKEHSITPYLWVNTRGGSHLLIHRATGLTGEVHRIFHQFCIDNSRKDWLTREKKGLLAIPGTYQGGHLVTWCNY